MYGGGAVSQGDEVRIGAAEEGATQAAGPPGQSRLKEGPTHLQGCRRGVPLGRVDTGVQDRWVGT